MQTDQAPQQHPSTIQIDDSKALADLAAWIKERQDAEAYEPRGPATVRETLASVNARFLAMTPEQIERDEQVKREAEQRELDRIKAEKESRPHRWRTFCEARDCTAYADVTLGGFVLSKDSAACGRQKGVVDAIRDYTASVSARRAAGEGVLLYGPPGTGKDHFAMIVMRAAFVGCGMKIERINGPEWYGALRDMMDSESSLERVEIDRLSKCDYLLVSDPLPPIGSLSSYQSSMLYRVLEKRQATDRPTIVTMNCDGIDDATKRLGGPTVDRMRFKSWVMECDWPSHRKPAKVIRAT
jgi:DNA replication protein DnaC